MIDGPLTVSLYFVGYAKGGRVQHTCDGPWVDIDVAIKRVQLHRDFELHDPGRYVLACMELCGDTWVENPKELQL